MKRSENSAGGSFFSGRRKGRSAPSGGQPPEWRVLTLVPDRCRAKENKRRSDSRRAAEYFAHPHRIERRIDRLHLLRGQADFCGTDVFPQAVRMPRPGDGNDPELFVQHPRQGDLRRRSAMLLRQPFHKGEQRTVPHEALPAELGHRGPIVGR